MNTKYYPPDHKLGMKIPKGGSSCANCYALDAKTKKNCTNKYFQKWNKEENNAKDPSKLPAPPDQYCCDLYTLPESTTVESLLEINL